MMPFSDHFCALLENGLLRCIPEPHGCFLSSSTSSDGCPEEMLVNLAIAAGPGGQCALREGRVFCMGVYVTPTHRPFDLSEIRGFPTARSVVVGVSHACILAHDDSVWCWGNNATGALGYVSDSWSPAPHRVEDLPPIRHISTSGGHVCALDHQGAIWCWGRNIDGELGCGVRPIQRTPCRTLP
ncbi:MAG: hypothetical protein HY909_14830 [Deltaproteobacteria bacterium]|nr:hypothetical protein [Deltaproteobacteria bacterium]